MVMSEWIWVFCSWMNPWNVWCLWVIKDVVFESLSSEESGGAIQLSFELLLGHGGCVIKRCSFVSCHSSKRAGGVFTKGINISLESSKIFHSAELFS